MDTPTRRDFFTYAVGATLASAVSFNSSRRDPSLLPLSVDLTGPMGFIMAKGVVEIRLPKLAPPDAHQGEIETSAGSVLLDGDDYRISFETPPPSPHPAPSIHVTKPCEVYTQPASQTEFAKSNFIHLTLPMPNNIVALSGYLAWIYTTDPSATNPQPDCTPDKPKCTLYARGLRFLYKHAGTPTFALDGNPAQPIPLDVADFENQVNISISYAPVNLPDDGWDNHSRKAFSQLASLFGLGRAVEIESDKCSCKASDSDKRFALVGAHRTCSPIMVVNVKR